MSETGWRPIERAARALASEEGYAYDPEPYDRRARVVLQAIREPSEAMIAEGWLQVSMSHPEQDDLPRGTETECWQAMIDAALSE